MTLMLDWRTMGGKWEAGMEVSHSLEGWGGERKGGEVKGSAVMSYEIICHVIHLKSGCTRPTSGSSLVPSSKDPPPRDLSFEGVGGMGLGVRPDKSADASLLLPFALPAAALMFRLRSLN